MAVTADWMERRIPGRAREQAGIGFREYLQRVGELCECCSDDRLALRVGHELQRLIAAGHDWLPADCCRPADDTYRRHVLYGDPLGRFTVLSVVWMPGQGTPLHGHTAWGAVGVYRGRPSVANYRLCREGSIELACQGVCRPGDVTCVQAGIDHPHRVFNDSDDIAITIHTYGRDLVEDPAGINIPV